MNFLDPTPGLAARFGGFARGLYLVLAKYTVEHRSSWPLIGLICNRLMGRSKRFAALVARFEAGTLPPPRNPAPVRAKPDGAKPEGAGPGPLKPGRAPDPVPRRRAYLLELGKHEAAYYGGVLELLVADPQMMALLQASPQARRLIRPLWLMLIPRPLPEILRPPPRTKPAAALSATLDDSPLARPAPTHAPARLPDVRRARVRAARLPWRGQPMPA